MDLKLQNLLQQLTRSGAQLRTGAEVSQSLETARSVQVLPTHVPELDRLQNGGLPRATLIEVSGPRSSGRLAIGLVALSAATQAGEAAAFIDVADSLEPEGAQASGVDLRRCLWIRPPSLRLALLATERVLSTGFPLVVLEMGEQEHSPVHSTPAVWLRLSKAVEEHHAIVVVISPSPLPSTAVDVQMKTTSPRMTWTGQHPVLFSALTVQLSVQRRRGLFQHREGLLTFQRRQSLGW